MKLLFDGFILSLQLLTTLPIRKEVEWDHRRAAASVAFYPLVGFILGCILSGVYALLINFTEISPLMLVAVLLTVSLAYSGGLHLDGWADFHDAVFSRRSKERKLEIMSDPQVGTFAVLAVLFLLGWRFVFLYEMMQSETGEKAIFYALLFIPYLCRLLMGWQLLIGNFAKKDGMAVALEHAKSKKIVLIYSVWTIGALLLILFTEPAYIVLLITAFVFLIGWLIWVKEQLGGITGDTIGAGAEGGETVLWGIVLLLLSFVMG